MSHGFLHHLLHAHSALVDHRSGQSFAFCTNRLTRKGEIAYIHPDGTIYPGFPVERLVEAAKLEPYEIVQVWSEARR